MGRSVISELPSTAASLFLYSRTVSFTRINPSQSFFQIPNSKADCADLLIQVELSPQVPTPCLRTLNSTLLGLRLLSETFHVDHVATTDHAAKSSRSSFGDMLLSSNSSSGRAKGWYTTLGFLNQEYEAHQTKCLSTARASLESAVDSSVDSPLDLGSMHNTYTLYLSFFLLDTRLDTISIAIGCDGESRPNDRLPNPERGSASSLPSAPASGRVARLIDSDSEPGHTLTQALARVLT